MRIARWILAALVALCIGVQVLEASGRWDRSLQDAGDEAIVVVLVLCVGVAVAAGRALIDRMRRAQISVALLLPVMSDRRRTSCPRPAVPTGAPSPPRRI